MTPDDHVNISGKVALITGGSKGTGKQIKRKTEGPDKTTICAEP